MSENHPEASPFLKPDLKKAWHFKHWKVPLFCTPRKNNTFSGNYRDLERKWVTKYLGQAGIHEAMKGHAVYTKKNLYSFCFFFFEVRSPKLSY